MTLMLFEDTKANGDKIIKQQIHHNLNAESGQISQVHD